MEYLGYKGGLIGPVLDAIETGGPRRLRVLDAFSGTGVVAAAMRARGHVVHANDHLALCEAWASAALLVPSRPSFKGIRCSSRPEKAAQYESLVAELNALSGSVGFVTRHFSPLSASTDGVERRYLTTPNATRVDAIRAQIRDWEADLTRGERGLLLSTLVAAVMRVSNTAGTYGCYLKRWKKKSLEPLKLSSLPLPGDDHIEHRVSCAEADVAASEADVDVIYADPPYTKRQYAAYYHVLETLIRDDEPALVGSTGLRNWQSQASSWCYKRRAPGALDALVTKSSAPRFVLSYSEDGQISHDQILDILEAQGSVTFREMVQRRYRSSRLPHKGADVVERIYVLDRT